MSATTTAPETFDVEFGTDLAVVDTAAVAEALIAGLKADSSLVHSTLTGSGFETQVQIFAAVTDAEDIAEHLNETIFLEHVIAQAIEIKDSETGQPVTVVRTVLIDADGTAYAAMSTGIVRSMQTLFSIVGQPGTWPQPLPIIVSEKKSTGVRKFFTVTIDRAALKPAPAAKK